MKRLLLFAVFCCLLPSFAVGETVLLFSYLPEDDSDVLSFIEDGIMDEFFNDGHIIFNGTSNDEVEFTLPMKVERLSKQIAKRGGATFLLELDIVLKETDPGVRILDSADFIFTDLVSDEVLSDGHYSSEEVYFNPDRSNEENYCDLGRIIARGAISAL